MFLRTLVNALVALLSLWGGANLLWALRAREAPASRQSRLLAGLGSILLALAPLLHRTGHTLLALLSGLTGLGCTLAWLIIVYKQSLHNTTM